MIVQSSGGFGRTGVVPDESHERPDEIGVVLTVVPDHRADRSVDERMQGVGIVLEQKIEYG